MTTVDPQVRRRPSPRPLVAAAGNSPVPSGGSPKVENACRPAETAPELSTLQPADPVPAVTARDRLSDLWPRLRAYWVPPTLLTDPPPAVTELAGYARHGKWTASTGKVRQLGVWWYRLVALPVTVACRYIEWMFQRPGRLIPVFALWKLFIDTGGGPWIAANLIRPALAVLGWVWL